MATLTISKKELEKISKFDDNLVNTINLMGIPVESQNEDSLVIEVLPNRADALSAQGFLRALKSFLGKETGLKKYNVKKPESDFRVKINPNLKNIRPHTACAIVKGIEFTNERIIEVIDMQEKLHTTLGRARKKLAIGIYPLDKISLPISFEAKAPKDIIFRPLEFDRELNGLEILQRHPTGREYASLLEGLEKYPVFIDSKGKILSMPPIINSHETGKIDLSTKDVFIECSGFNFELLKKTLNIIVTTLADMGGKIYQMELEYPQKILTPDLTPEKMKVSLENVNKLIGLKLTDSDLQVLPPKMGYDYAKGVASIPSWRADIIHEVDIIEDIAIAYGYDKIIPKVPSVATFGEESAQSVLERKLSEILSGLGLIEISSYNLIKEEEAKKIGIQDIVQTENAKSEYKILRPSLSVPALCTFSENKDNEYPQKIFEIGTVFSKDTKGITETGVVESERLLVALSPGAFTEGKQILDYLFKMLDVSYELKEGNHPLLIDGRTGVVLAKGKKYGYIGEVHPQTLREWNIKMPIVILEIELSCFSS